MNPNAVLPVESLKEFQVNRSGQQEVIRQPLYDYQTYAQAGQTSLTFFQIPVGQSGKTLADTNMENAGSLPAPKSFLLKGLEVVFFPGAEPGTYGAPDDADFINDMNDVYESGHVQLFIGSKAYLDEAPIGVMPPSWGLGGFSSAADTTTAGADQQTLVNYARSVGRPYTVIPMYIPSNQNFKVTINWPTAVAVTVAGRIGVRLLGDQYRLSQ